MNSKLINMVQAVCLLFKQMCSLFFTLTKEKKEEITIREYSDIFKWEYDSEEVHYIPNMTQNYFYFDSPLSEGQLIDIIPGKKKRVVFVWKRSKEMSELYKIWCTREADEKQVIQDNECKSR